MKPEVARIIRDADMTGWKSVGVEYGTKTLQIQVPATGCAALTSGSQSFDEGRRAPIARGAWPFSETSSFTCCP